MIHIYTGDGKGKTTTAVGLAVRASKNLRVLFIQLIKKGDSSEAEVLKNIPNIEFKAFGGGKWILEGDDRSKERKNANKALMYARSKLESYNVLIMDEVVTAISLKVISTKEILEFLNVVPRDKEIILTGRGATENLIERADLVTEMRKIKHYFDKGVKARKGIEL